HFPQNSGVPFTAEAVARLVDRHGNVVIGLKDSSGDLAYSSAIARAHRSLAVFPSAEAALMHENHADFAGCISATLNITSSLVAQAMRDAVGNAIAPRAMLNAASAIRSALASVPLVAAVKWALADLEHDAQWETLMPPLAALTSDQRDALQRALAAT